MYKKKSTIAVFLFFAILNIQAQVIFKPGLRGGLSLSTISEMHANYRSNFYIGGFGEINLTKKYALQPEIGYIKQGSNNVARNYYDPVTETDKVTYEDLKLDYLSCSLINKFTMEQGFQILFGPSLDFRLKDNLVLRKNYNDLAFNLGLGYRMPSGLAFDIRFKKGFLDILDSDYYTNDSNNDYFFGDYNTNVNFQMGVSYSFNVK